MSRTAQITLTNEARQQTVADYERLVRANSLSGFAVPGLPESHPEVSVVVLNLNGARVLRRCLDSLCNQSFAPSEVVIVDNGSTDHSLEIVNSFDDRLALKVIESQTNLGVAGGRNEALHHVSGEIVAFLDNDGFASREWLKIAVSRLCSQSDIGAVASSVFFADRPSIVNGIGGTMNSQGFAWDQGYNQPVEIVDWPSEVLFPMGCGMVLWRKVIDEVGFLDDALPKWYDDTEWGLRVWAAGLRVVSEPLAVVEHDAHSGDKQRTAAAWRRALLFHSARFRMVLKYFPISAILNLPALELSELLRLPWLQRLKESAVRLLALGWNLTHLPSCFRIRRKFSSKQDLFLSRVYPQVEQLAFNCVDNRKFQADWDYARVSAELCKQNAEKQLHFGWSGVADGNPIRFVAGAASLFLKVPCEASLVRISYLNKETGAPPRIEIRSTASGAVLAEFSLMCDCENIVSQEFPVELKAGVYEIVFFQTTISENSTNRNLSLGIQSVELV